MEILVNDYPGWLLINFNFSQGLINIIIINIVEMILIFFLWNSMWAFNLN